MSLRQFLFLKGGCWLEEFADCLFMTLCLWTFREAVECGDGFHCCSVGVLVFASVFYDKK